MISPKFINNNYDYLELKAEANNNNSSMLIKHIVEHNKRIYIKFTKNYVKSYNFKNYS